MFLREAVSMVLVRGQIVERALFAERYSELDFVSIELLVLGGANAT